MKFTHTHNAWHQLLSLYLPVLQKYLPETYRISVLEVCRTASVDPLFDFIFTFPKETPEKPTVLLLPDIEL